MVQDIRQHGYLIAFGPSSHEDGKQCKLAGEFFKNVGTALKSTGWSAVLMMWCHII